MLYGYWPWRMPLLIVAFFSACISFAWRWLTRSRQTPQPSDLRVGLIALVIAVFGFWHGFRNFRYRKYIAFDRKRHLVHIPRLFGMGMDVVRWEDAGFCVVNTITGYAGLRTAGNIYVCRLPWDLVRHGYPPMRYRVWIRVKRIVMVAGRPAERIWRASWIS